jgi:hypothetical protein
MKTAGCLLVAAPALAALLAPQTVFRARTDIVAVDVAVADGRRPILDLTKGDFELRDNGVLQSMTDFDREKLPLDVTLTIDLSGSMTRPKLASVEHAVAQVGATLHEVDRIAVQSFHSIVTERWPMQPPPARVALNTGGSRGTSIVDALLLSLVTAPAPDRRQLSLFMTDGDDTSSVFDLPTTAETAKFSSAQVSFVIVRDNGKLNNGRMVTLFRIVARTTGGDIIELGKDDDLSKAFLAAIENFRTSYVLRYAPTGVPAPGWHDVEVRVKNRKYTVRARRGYWADRL